jgi:hypothetical protein
VDTDEESGCPTYQQLADLLSKNSKRPSVVGLKRGRV